MEYLVLESVKVQDLQETLTNQGKLDWELVSATHVHSVRPFFMLVFKREEPLYVLSTTTSSAEPSTLPEAQGDTAPAEEAPKASNKKEKAKSPVNIGVAKK